jgi:hypothetical protein
MYLVRDLNSQTGSGIEFKDHWSFSPVNHNIYPDIPKLGHIVSEGDDTDTKLHSKADQGGDEESTSRSMTRRQQRYANEGDLV